MLDLCAFSVQISAFFQCCVSCCFENADLRFFFLVNCIFCKQYVSIYGYYLTKSNKILLF